MILDFLSSDVRAEALLLGVWICVPTAVTCNVVIASEWLSLYLLREGASNGRIKLIRSLTHTVRTVILNDTLSRMRSKVPYR